MKNNYLITGTLIFCLLVFAPLAGCGRNQGLLTSEHELGLENENSTWTIYISNNSDVPVKMHIYNDTTDFVPGYTPSFPGGRHDEVKDAVLLPGKNTNIQCTTRWKTHAFNIIHTFIVSSTQEVAYDMRIEDNGRPRQDLASGFESGIAVGTQEFDAVVSQCKYQDTVTYDVAALAAAMASAVVDKTRHPLLWQICDRAFAGLLGDWKSYYFSEFNNYAIGFAGTCLPPD